MSWQSLGLMSHYTDIEYHTHTKRLVWSDTKKPRQTAIHVDTMVYGFRRDREHAEVVWQRRHVWNGYHRTGTLTYTLDARDFLTTNRKHYLQPWRCIQRLPA